MQAQKINLGCGPIFVDTADWVNLDFSPSSNAVRQANLLAPLPFSDSTVGVVYSSHFLEHVPRAAVAGVLTECFRVLKPGGVLRFVLPDLENLCRAYLAHRYAGDHDKADFIVLEMIDQCVRDTSGGELGRYYQCLRQSTSPERLAMMAFVQERTGEDLTATVQRARKLGGAALRQLASRGGQLVSRAWITSVLKLLPAAFRAQNVSLAAVGERHHWLWDFHQLAVALQTVGFIDVNRQSANQSAIADFPFSPLDLDAHGRPRKGAESMFVEARKPG